MRSVLTSGAQKQVDILELVEVRQVVLVALPHHLLVVLLLGLCHLHTGEIHSFHLLQVLHLLEVLRLGRHSSETTDLLGSVIHVLAKHLDVVGFAEAVLLVLLLALLLLLSLVLLILIEHWIELAHFVLVVGVGLLTLGTCVFSCFAAPS